MYILAIDLGTTSVKVSLVDRKAQVIQSAHRRVNTTHRPGGVSEQDPQEWIRAIEANWLSIRQKGFSGYDVEALVTTGHMMGCLAVDELGNPLLPHMLHSDHRGKAEAEWCQSLLGEDTLYQMSGNLPGASSSLAKMLWIKNNYPDIYNRTAYFLNAKDYIGGFLTGNFGCTDYSDASHCGVLDIHQLTYRAEIYQELGLLTQKMPRVLSGDQIIGSLSADSAGYLELPQGIPVILGAGDGACSALGAGVNRPGESYCCMGTTAWIAHLWDKPMLDKQKRCYSIVSADGKSVGSYGTIQNCGRSTDFGRSFFGVADMEEFNLLAETAPVGANGLIFLPYLNGERAPLFDPSAQGIFYGLQLGQHKGDGLRSILEGVALALRQNLEVQRENGALISEFALIGGGGKSSLWRQIMADVLGAEVLAADVPSEDATTLGAALLGAVGIGWYDTIDEGVAQIKTIERIRPDTSSGAVYDQIYRRYQALYPALKPVFALG